MGIKAKAVELLIQYMYTGCIDFSLGNIIDLIWASDLLQLPEIKEQGLDKLEEHIDFCVSTKILENVTIFNRNLIFSRLTLIYAKLAQFSLGPS